MQKQIAEFDQQVDIVHELVCTITDESGNTEVKVKFFRIDSEIDHGYKL
jgi:hypothetical protein